MTYVPEVWRVGADLARACGVIPEHVLEINGYSLHDGRVFLEFTVPAHVGYPGDNLLEAGFEFSLTPGSLVKVTYRVPLALETFMSIVYPPPPAFDLEAELAGFWERFERRLHTNLESFTVLTLAQNRNIHLAANFEAFDRELAKATMYRQMYGGEGSGYDNRETGRSSFFRKLELEA